MWEWADDAIPSFAGRNVNPRPKHEHERVLMTPSTEMPPILQLDNKKNSCWSFSENLPISILLPTEESSDACSCFGWLGVCTGGETGMDQQSWSTSHGTLVMIQRWLEGNRQRLAVTIGCW